MKVSSAIVLSILPGLLYASAPHPRSAWEARLYKERSMAPSGRIGPQLRTSDINHKQLRFSLNASRKEIVPETSDVKSTATAPEKHLHLQSVKSVRSLEAPPVETLPANEATPEPQNQTEADDEDKEADDGSQSPYTLPLAIAFVGAVPLIFMPIAFRSRSEEEITDTTQPTDFEYIPEDFADGDDTVYVHPFLNINDSDELGGPSSDPDSSTSMAV